LGEAYWYDFLVVNDKLEEALGQLQAIVVASRCHTRRLWPRLAERFGF
jgi:guanylate kinase